MAKRHSFLLNPPWHGWVDVNMIELIHATFPLYALYLNDNDPADLETYMDEVMDLDGYDTALRYTEELLYSIPNVEVDFLDGSMDRDFSICIRRHTVLVEIIEYEYGDERHDLSDLYRRHQGHG